MTDSKLIAGLIGPTLVAAGAAILLNLGSIGALADEATRDPALIMLSGVLAFVAGLAIVRVHNRWTGGWPVIVTVLGWVFVLGGLIRLLFPARLASLAVAFVQTTGLVAGEAVVLLLVGAFLSFKAYGRD